MTIDTEPAAELRFCHLDDDRDVALEGAWRLLSTEEQTRAERFAVDRDRDRFARARGFLRRTLGARLGTPPERIAFLSEANGKPRLADHVLHFNLSHSQDLAVVAICADRPVGVDLELKDRRINAEELAKRVLTPFERAALSQASPESRNIRFLEMWTAKEARMKLSGEGMSRAPAAIELALDGGGRPVSYVAPAAPPAGLRFIVCPDPRAICCLATWRA